MLIRVGGGHSGIKEYLEKGQKQGRDFSRDELDERVILAGDLELTDHLIQSLDREGERYLHITLAFKEDELSKERMQEIVQEFGQFTFSAYRAEEYNFYAEAHLPKIKSYVNEQNGEFIERKPHIHIVIPKTNLLTGSFLNPFGMVEHQEKFIDAFQEHINNKYGLASPKNNRRIEFTSESDVISRFKGDYFEGQSKDIKSEILNAVLDRKIESHQEFKALLAEFGETKTRNAGKDNEYQNVKPEGSAKGINLNHYVFTKQFIELPLTEKKQALTAEIQQKYEIEGEARKDPQHIESALTHWHQFRAKEVKYLNSGNKKLYDAYREAEPEVKQRMLEAQSIKFYQHTQEESHASRRSGRSIDHTAYDRYRYDPIEHGAEKEGREGQEAERTRERRIDRFASDREHRSIELAGFEKTESIDSMRSLSGLTVVRNTPKPEVLLSADASYQLEHGRAGTHDELRWDRDRQRTGGVSAQRPIERNPIDHEYGYKQPKHTAGQQPLRNAKAAKGARDAYSALTLHLLEKSASLHQVKSLSSLTVLDGSPPPAKEDTQVTGRPQDSVVGQLSYEFAEQQRIMREAGTHAYQEIKRDLDAHRLLAELSHSHGVIVKKYAVSSAADGSHRILCGNRHLNVSDFLTKELRLSWVDASRILRNAYQRQLDSQPVRQQKSRADRTLWREFQAQQSSSGGYKQQRSQQYLSEKMRRDALALDFDQKIKVALQLSPSKQKSSLSVISMQKIAAEKALKEAIRDERRKLFVPLMVQYQTYLQQRAGTGDTGALAELRSMKTEWIERSPSEAGIASSTARKGVEPQEDNAIIYRAKKVSYEVERNGDVLYALAGIVILKDQGNNVKMLRTDRESIEIGLRLAQEKFGNNLELTGSKEFRERAAKVAAESGMGIVFSDVKMNQVVQDRVSELAQKKMHQEIGRTYVQEKRQEKSKQDENLERTIQEHKPDPSKKI